MVYAEALIATRQSDQCSAQLIWTMTVILSGFRAECEKNSVMENAGINEMAMSCKNTVESMFS